MSDTIELGREGCVSIEPITVPSDPLRHFCALRTAGSLACALGSAWVFRILSMYECIQYRSYAHRPADGLTQAQTSICQRRGAQPRRAHAPMVTRGVGTGHFLAGDDGTA